MGRIAIVSASLGAGHDGAAREIGRRLADAGHDVSWHDFLDLLPVGVGRRMKSAYRTQLDVAPGSWEWLLTALRRRGAVALVAWLAASAGRALRRIGTDADAVVCTYPLASQVAMRLRRQGRLRAPVLTYLTDPSVHPLWIATGTDLYLAPHQDIAEQVRAFGDHPVAVVAPAVRQAFRPPSDEDERLRERARFGLPADAVLAAVLSGSWAVGEIEQSARDIAASGVAVPVVVCGENAALRERLRDLTPGVVFGWVDDMPGLLRACDVAVFNSGGLSFFEVHATGLPLLLYRCLPGHGRTNADSLEHAGMARWAHDAEALASALRSLDRPAVTAPAACPAVAIDGVLGDRGEAPRWPTRTRRLRTRAGWAVAVFAWLLWTFTSGTSFAVAHGFRGIDSATTPRGDVYVVVEAPLHGLVGQDALRRLTALHAAVAVSVPAAQGDPDAVRQLAAAGLVVVNSAGGMPYETGWFTGRGAIGAGAREIGTLTGHRPGLLLSNGDLDAVDVSTAARYGERFLIPTRTLGCAGAVGLPRHGGIVLVRQDDTAPCDLDRTLMNLTSGLGADRLRTLSLRAVTS
ncbi:MAG TPA: glycosyltransferase [Pseudonocardiaceae bacterium]|nr:glycosyltransferase [Pseudonocardiaceae bacterium]